MSPRVLAGAFGIFALIALTVAPVARADGPSDLKKGITFYEDLNLDRARIFLNRAAKAEDLSAADRARAYLYLGLLEFDLGRRKAAEAAWLRAFQWDPRIQAPKGISPKTRAAFEMARTRAPPPKIAPPPPPEPPRVSTPPPEPPPAVQVTPPPPVIETNEDGVSPWLWVGVGTGAAIIAGVVAGILLSSSDETSACAEGGGGCILVRVR